GTVITSEDGPNTGSFRFVIDDKAHVRKGQFVQLDTHEGLMICRVSEVFKTNHYFERAESVSEYQKSGRPLMEQFPVGRWEYTVAEAVPLGIYSNGGQHRSSFPPSPGDKVHSADESLLADFFGFDGNDGVKVGKVEFHEVPANLNLTKLFQKHLAILAMSGAGKSYTAGVLMEEILERRDELGKPAIIVFDPHGEYAGFAEGKYGSMVNVFSSENIAVATNKLSITNIGELIPQMSAVQRRELLPIINKLRETKRVYTLFDVISEVENSDINPKTKIPMISWLADLNYTGLFESIEKPSIETIAQPGKLNIFDLSDFVHLKQRQIVVAYFAKKLFEARRQGKIPPFIMFVEEAHQFAPGGEEEERAVSRGVIEQIAREGRKFHACMTLITQRPKRLSITALSQCNTNIILRITNPMDLKHIEESSEGISRDVLDMIPGLKVGEALVVGEAVNYPVLIKVRQRNSVNSDRGVRLEDAIAKYKLGKSLDAADMEAFM
ncbi:ATP-binding protein, partial [archaeon]